MGGRKSSSKSKSSKKKKSKISSKMQKRKNRSNKSKKVSRSDDYTSSSDYSSSPQFTSSSSSEDDYSRKGRMHSRDVKSMRKRSRRSSSRDASEGPSPVRKKKRSNRKGLDHRKKSQKKKRRRYSSISSMSSSSEGSDVASPRIKSRVKTKDKRIPDEPNIGKKRSRHRRTSCSTCDHHPCSCSITHSVERYAEENKPKRLKSVITVAEKTHEKEGDKQAMDTLKEEIIYKPNDFPSPRSDDSNHLEHKRKLASASCFSSDQKMQSKDLVIDNVFLPNNITANHIKDVGGIDLYPNKLVTLSPNMGGESDVSVNNANSGFEDLEISLRQKALENLQKFRTKLQPNVKHSSRENKNASDVESTAKTEVVKYMSPVEENREGLALTQVIGCRSKLVLTEDFSHPTKIELDTPVEENNRKESGGVKQSDIHVQRADRSPLSQNLEKVNHTSDPAFVNELGLGKPSCSTPVQAHPKENSLASKRNIMKSVPVRSGPLSTETSNNLCVGAVNVSVSPTAGTTHSVRSTSTEHTSKNQQGETNTSENQQDENKEGSQFEQKTMSVMRDGEMVQVSYKVYIPKRAPALARRQLKR